MGPLSDYDMSAARGFLSRHNADDVPLPPALQDVADVALRLPQILPSGKVRSFLKANLPHPTFDPANLTDEQARRLMVHYSFMVQAYVWGEPDAPKVLPKNLAMPMVAIADHLGQQPLLPYSGYVLDNWGLLDKDGAIDLDNIFMIQNFLSGQDEAWFVLIHVAIEAQAGEALNMFSGIIEAANSGDANTCAAHLRDMAGVWKKLNAIFDRMPERCDPYIYFERVRPYIHGWRDNPALPDGIIYEGTRYGSAPQAFRGQTGSQSSIVPSMDALLNIGHAADPLREYLDQLHIYRPTAHRRFIDDVRAASRLRNFVKTAKHAELTFAYNGVIQAVADFRSRHLEYAASYINKQSKNAAGNDVDVGTGGTPFMKYLKKHRDETQANLL